MPEAERLINSKLFLCTEKTGTPVYCPLEDRRFASSSLAFGIGSSPGTVDRAEFRTSEGHFTLGLPTATTDKWCDVRMAARDPEWRLGH
jgi:hypothetical protein